MNIDVFQDYRGNDSRSYRKECDVGSGAWVLVKCKIPVSENERPQTYGIYWAIPAPDTYGRQKVRIYTPYEVCLLNWEYKVISEERLQEYKECGYYLRDYGVPKSDPLTMKLVEKGKHLTEEEREIIFALQLDGLSEQQACEEYFLSHHNDYEKKGYCYLPDADTLSVIEACFGKNGIPG